MDYNNPTKSGQIAYLRRVKRNENPVCRRTHANHHTLWDRGWVRQSEIKCRGIEVAHDVFTGCTQTNGDCPECGL